MGRVGTLMALVSCGWGPSGRLFKSGLPDSQEARMRDRVAAWLLILIFASADDES
jgi:hypothetical protein